MGKKLVTCMVIMLISLGFNVDALSQSITDLEKEKTRLMRNEASAKNLSSSSDLDIANFLDKIKKLHEKNNGSLSESSDRVRVWFSKDPADLAPLRGTKWNFYYTFSSGLQTDTITFGSSVQTTSDGTVALLCSHKNGIGAVFYTDFPSAFGGGRGFSALIDWAPIEILDFYFFKVSGSSASGHYIFEVLGMTSKIYSLTGTKVGGSTTTIATSTTTTTTIPESFVYVNPSGCGGHFPCYSTVQEAIDAAISGDTVMIDQGTYNEDIYIDTSKHLILSGGWHLNFTTQSGNSMLNSLTIDENGGPVEVDGVVLK